MSRGFQDADNRRVELCSSLGIDLETGWADAMVAMRRRLMPEGMEWPRFEDGEPVRLGDEVQAHNIGQTSHVTSIVLSELGSYVYYRWGGKDDRAGVPGNRVKRPAPKVLDEDGVEIRVGDTVYDMVGDRHEVKGFGKQGDVLLEFHNDESLGWRPSNFTHRAPVLAADGKPLREGETVWYTPKNLGYPIECRVEKVNGDGSCELIDVVIPTSRPTVNHGKLTHERPDSWERLEEDAGKNPFGYCKDVGHRLDTCENSEAYKARDLVRRAKKLAGVEA